MRKIMSLFIVFMFVMSGMTIAENSEVDDVDEEDVEEYIEENAQGKPVDECVRRVKAEFPDVRPARAKELCTKLLRVKQVKAVKTAAAEKVQARKTAAEDWRLRKANQAGNAAEKWVKSLSKERADIFLHLPRAEQKEILEKKKADVLDRYTLAKKKVDELYRQREIASVFCTFNILNAFIVCAVVASVAICIHCAFNLFAFTVRTDLSFFTVSIFSAFCFTFPIFTDLT